MENPRELMLGNQAIARGLAEAGCAMATSYPGTPASEILPAVAALKQAYHLPIHVQWAVNEKIAFEIAYAGAISGLRTAVSMKQVGLNVAADPLMSAAYMGTRGGFVVVSADDPGPHSSQTEQDSRLMAMMAKIPVLDPDSPAQARQMATLAFELSERFAIPVMLRPTTRVCHSRQDIGIEAITARTAKPDFQKDPGRWAATPKFRLALHGELEEKLSEIAAFDRTAPVRINPETESDKAVLVSGVAAAHAKELLTETGLSQSLALYQILQPFPLHTDFIAHILQDYQEVLVIEETVGVIEMQLADRHKVKGKRNGFVPKVGELAPEAVGTILNRFAGTDFQAKTLPAVPGRRPTLCAGCPHRASFFAIKKAAPKGIYTSDIGCYTLGLNLGAVDTVLCMGAAISQAAGFYHAYKDQEKPPDIIASIGDSTFFHAGLPALADAVIQKARFLLVILDNRTTAMTGNQPTPETGIGACGEPLASIDLPALIKGCGVEYCRTGDPYQLKAFTRTLKEALRQARENGPCVVIARHPCLLDRRQKDEQSLPVKVEINENCDGCRFCIDHFECPALVMDKHEEKVTIDRLLCSGCGVCIEVCPKQSIQEVRA